MGDLRSPIIVDLDTGAGVHNAQGISLQISANGGPIEAKGQKAMASSIPIVIASDQSTLPVSIAATVTVDTELPAAAALADATANPTVPGVGAFLEGYNGTTWDRLRSTTANGLAVDVTRVQGTVTVDSELPAAASLTDAFANPTAPAVGSFLMGWNSATWDRLKSTTANGLVVDVSRVQGTVTVDSELPAAAALTDAFANPTAPGVGAFLMGWNSATWDRLKSTTANGLAVDVTRVQGTVTVDSELPAAAALADATANPTVPGVGGFLIGYNGTTWDRVRTANTGRLQVDVITGGGAATPTTPVTAYVTSASLAAGSSTNLDTADIGAQRCTGVEVWTTVAYKVAVYKVLNSVADTNPTVIGGGQAFQSFQWKPPHPDYIKTTASAGTDGFRVAVTNLDDASAADVYTTVHYEV